MKTSFLLLLLTCSTFQCFAFKPERHAAIEKEAKVRLRKLNPAIMDYLEREIDNFSTGSSAHPDMDLLRQFGSDRQVYHFMADMHYAVEAGNGGKTTEEKRRILLKKGMADCMELMYLLLRETVENHDGADQAGRGIFVLMHIVADSYSREHTTRNNQNELVTIKSWKLSKLHWNDNCRDMDDSIPGKSRTYALLHSVKGAADSEDFKDGKFTEEGEAAIKALMDVMTAVYQAENDRSNAEKYIIGFMQSHFKPEHSSVAGSTFVYDEGGSVELSFKEDYESDDGAVMEFDLYPSHSFAGGYRTSLSDFDRHSFGMEYGFHFTPYAASMSGSLLRRIPFGILFSAYENSRSFKHNPMVKTLQMEITPEAIFYLPIADSNLKMKTGYGCTPFNKGSFNNAFIFGVVFQQHFGASHWYYEAGWEYISSGLPGKNNGNLKLGYNLWQGRVIKRH